MKRMNGTRRLGAALLLCLLMLAACLPALAAQTEKRVFDEAGLLTPAQEESLAARIAELQGSTGMDFVVLTSKQPHGDADQQQIADEYYDRYGFGLDEENSGVLLYIDMYDRQYYISTTGAMIDYLTDERIERVLDAMEPGMRRGDYAEALDAGLSKVEQFIRAGIPEGQYRYDVVTGQMLTARHKVLTAGEIAFGLVAGVVLALIVTLCVQRSYKLKGNTYSYDYRQQSDMELTQNEDVYVRTTTTRTRKVQNEGGGRGGFGGGGGGSGVHSSGGGVSHGGGGRGF